MRQQIGDARRLIGNCRSDDITGLAAELAYRTLLALFPFLIFLAALGGFIASAAGIDNPSERIMSALEDSLPSDASGVLRQQLREVLENRSLGLLSLGLAGTIWSASSAMGSLVKALNRIYGVRETRPFWRRTLMSIALTLVAGVFFTAAFTALMVGQIFASGIGDQLGIHGLAVEAANWLRIPAVILILALATAFLYQAAPNADVPFRRVWRGVLVFVVAWVLFTLAFGVYVSQFGTYNETYGTLGGVVILMVWTYLSSLLLLAGAELNALFLGRAQVAPESHVTALPQATAIR